MLDLFADEFTGLGGRRLALAPCLSGAFYGLSFWHREPSFSDAACNPRTHSAGF
jgi:hypothetical protein